MLDKDHCNHCEWCMIFTDQLSQVKGGWLRRLIAANRLDKTCLHTGKGLRTGPVLFF